MNHLLSGLDADSQFVLGEKREEFAELQCEYFEHFQPATPEQRLQVDTLIRNEWTLRRLHRVEAHLWEYHSMRAERGTGVELGEAFHKASMDFMRLERRLRASEKACKDALATLTRLQAAPPPPPPPQPQQTTGETPQLGSIRIPDAKSPAFHEQMDTFIAEQLALHDSLMRNPTQPVEP